MMKKTAVLFLALVLCLCAFGAQALTVTGLETEPVGRSWETNKFFARMEELTGVAVQAQGVTDAEQYAQMLAAMERGEVETDVLFKANLTRAQERALLHSGAIIDLAPMIDAHMPNLSALLAEYGMRFDGNVLFEPQAYAGAAAHNIIPMYAGHEINAYFAENPIYVVSPSTSSLTLEGVGTAKGRAQALLATTSAAYAKDDVHYTSSAQAAGDSSGQFTVAAIAEDSVFLCGSRMIYADDLMATSSYANRMFLTRVVGALYSESVSVSIPAKTLDSALLPVSAGQAKGLGILLTAILPAAALLCGVTVIIRRRRTL